MSIKHVFSKCKTQLNQRGQGFIEYALILALVVGIVVFVGQTTLKTGVNSVTRTAMNSAISQAGSLGGGS